MRKSKMFTLLPALVALLVALSACGGNTASPATNSASTNSASTNSAESATSAPAGAAATSAPAASEATPAAGEATSAPAEATSAPAAGGNVEVSNPPTAPEMVDSIDLKGKNVQVTYWHNRPDADQKLLQSMLDEFNKSNPYGITAKAEIAGASYNDVYNKVNAAIQAGQPPAMSVAYQNQAAFYRASDAVIDLNPFINSSKYGLSQEDKADFYKTFLDSDANPQYKGERLGFPTQRSMAVLYYNADALKALGYNDPPQDWKTFEEAACKFSDPAKQKYGLAFQHDVSNLAGMIFANGGRVLAEDGQSYVFNSQAGVDAVTLLKDMFSKKCAVEVPASERNGEQSRFGSGNALFTFGSSSGLPYYADAVSKGGKFNWNIALFPHSGQPAVDLYGASISVYKTTPEQELASWLVIKFLSEKAQTTKWAAQTGYFPVRKSAEQDVISAFKNDPKYSSVADTYAKMFDWIQYAMVESPVAGYDPVRTLLDKEVLTAVMTNPDSVDPKAALDKAADEANQILKENAPAQ
ncbi:MAG TPA: ABC transporter substrate-binding protein [Roseiflexaceae bacterium]|nr:ABC transporter substrate-binding protein [Roseiflexaceae bacterium]